VTKEARSLSRATGGKFLRLTLIRPSGNMPRSPLPRHISYRPACRSISTSHGGQEWFPGFAGHHPSTGKRKYSEADPSNATSRPMPVHGRPIRSVRLIANNGPPRYSLSGDFATLRLHIDAGNKTDSSRKRKRAGFGSCGDKRWPRP